MNDNSVILVTHDGESNANMAMKAPMNITMNVNRYLKLRSIIWILAIYSL